MNLAAVINDKQIPFVCLKTCVILNACSLDKVSSTVLIADALHRSKYYSSVSGDFGLTLDGYDVFMRGVEEKRRNK